MRVPKKAALMLVSDHMSCTATSHAILKIIRRLDDSMKVTIRTLLNNDYCQEHYYFIFEPKRTSCHWSTHFEM